MTIEIHVDRWDVGGVIASMSLNGAGGLRVGGPSNPSDFMDYLCWLSAARRLNDTVRIFLPRPGSRAGLDGHYTPRLLELVARGVEVAAVDASGRLSWVEDATTLDAMGDEVATDDTEPVCDRSGDIGSRHVWDDGAQVGDWCRCRRRRRLLMPRPA